MKRTAVADAPGKLNLSFDITGVLPNGYHEVDTVMQSIDLYDTVTVQKNAGGEGIFISCDRPRIPCDETNHAYVAAKRFFEAFGIDEWGISIDIRKRVPVQAGLGGGSADAAGVLVALNALYEVGADLDALCGIGAKVGADVPFCLRGGTQRARGFGERLEALPALPVCELLIAQPELGISTPESYRRYDRLEAPEHPGMEDVLRCLRAGNVRGLAASMGNVLEAVAELPEVPEIKRKMLDNGALGALMTGSGSAVFGVFESRWLAKHCMRKLYGLAHGVYLARPIRSGAAVTDLR